jgi:hypothetical protein
MARSAGSVLVGVLAVVSLLLVAAGLIVALAIGLPALGLVLSQEIGRVGVCRKPIP